MSADPSLQRPDVDSDGPGADGVSGKNGSAPKNSAHQQGGGSGQPSRSRRNRRGRRRRGRRSGRGNGPQAGSDNPSGDGADSGESVAGASVGGVKKPRPGKNGHPKNNQLKKNQNRAAPTKNTSTKNGQEKNPPDSAADPTEPAKPSDLAGRNRRAAAASSPASMPRTRRRAARRPDSEGAPRLHTVRETSAGGLVLSDIDAPYSEISAALIGRIDRRGRMMWSLPKGHIELGESPEETAAREVAEETGIIGRVLRPIGTIDYWFVADNRRGHKTVHHHLLRAVGGTLSDEDVEVTEVAWVPLGELDEVLAYTDERRLVRHALSFLGHTAVAEPDAGTEQG